MSRASRLACPLLVALAAVGVSIGARAQGPSSVPEGITMEELVALALERVPEVLEARALVDVTRADLAAARTHPNPVVAYRLDRLATGANVNGQGQHDILVDQPFLLPGVRSTRRRAAELRVEASERRRDLVLHEVVAEARKLFVALHAQELRVLELERSRARVERLVGTLRARTALGASRAVDQTRFELERSLVTTALEAARTERDDRARAIGEFVALPGWAPATTAPPELGSFAGTGASRERSPRLVSARADVAAASAAIDEARVSAWPVPSAFVGALSTRGPASAAFSIGLGLPLPLFDRREGDRRRAAAELALAERRAADASSRWDAEHERLESALDGYEAALAGLGETSGFDLDEWVTRLEAGFASGQLDATAVLDGLRSARDRTLLRVDLLERALGVRIALLRLEGR